MEGRSEMELSSKKRVAPCADTHDVDIITIDGKDPFMSPNRRLTLHSPTLLVKKKKKEKQRTGLWREKE